jgi:hypothetical protein
MPPKRKIVKSYKSKCSLYVLPCVFGRCRSYSTIFSHLSSFLASWFTRGLSGWLPSRFARGVGSSSRLSRLAPPLKLPWTLRLANQPMMVHQSVVLLARLPTLLLLAHRLARTWVVTSALLVVLLLVLQFAHQWVTHTGSPVDFPVGSPEGSPFHLSVRFRMLHQLARQ